jgi:hypothetical protein
MSSRMGVQGAWVTDLQAGIMVDLPVAVFPFLVIGGSHVEV